VTPAWDPYLAFRRRALHRMAELAGLQRVDAPGLVGAVAVDGAARGGLLVVEPHGAGPLLEVLRSGLPQWVGLRHPDPCLLDALARQGWQVTQELQAMSLPDLRALRAVPMPNGISSVEVAISRGRPGFPLHLALEVQLEHDRDDAAAPTRDLELEAQLMRELSVRFFAAVTDDGACVGTAGSRVVDSSALVAAVTTIPAYRRRGLGTAMTCRALLSAREDGAGDAFLDATPAGAGIYRRLGFTELGPVVYLERPAA
jgi:ribosomal protein S18 acetylase RimI-like enzyme